MKGWLARGAIAPGVVLALAWPAPGDDTWVERRFKSRTVFERRLHGADSTLHAVARDANSGLFRRLDRDPRGVTLRWRWRALAHPAGADPGVRSRDDRAAGVMVLVRRGRMPWSWQALLYQWTPAAPAGTWSRSPYSGSVKTLVITHAPADSVWREVERDLEADLIRAFGELPASIEAIGLICDSDNTGGVSAAEFGRIEWIDPPR
jgi:hypothetical protein